MARFLTAGKGYYWASITMSLGAVYNLVKQNFIGVGIFLILSASLIAIGFIISRKNKAQAEQH